MSGTFRPEKVLFSRFRIIHLEECPFVSVCRADDECARLPSKFAGSWGTPGIAENFPTLCPESGPEPIPGIRVEWVHCTHCTGKETRCVGKAKDFRLIHGAGGRCHRKREEEPIHPEKEQLVWHYG